MDGLDSRGARERAWQLAPVIILFQLLRDALRTGLALAVVRMMRASRWGTSLAVALTLAVLLSLPMGLFPNPYMPPMVRQAHFYELASSTLVFGGIASWVLHTN